MPETDDWGVDGTSGECWGGVGSAGSGIGCAWDGRLAGRARRRGRSVKTYNKCNWKNV